MREYEGRRKGRRERHLILYGKHWLPAVKMMGIVLTVSSDHILKETLTARKSKWTPPEGQFASPSTIGRLVSLEELDDLFHLRRSTGEFRCSQSHKKKDWF